MRNELQEAIEYFEAYSKEYEPVSNIVPKYILDDLNEQTQLYRTALSALREKQQREAGCEWCTKLTNLSYSDASYYDDIRACVGMQKDIHILERHKKDDYVLNISSHAGNWIDYPIHYCPMCGRKLEDEK